MNTKNVPDPYLWLEEVEGEAALTWVREQNKRSLATITAHLEFESNYAVALDLATSIERIPYGSVRDGMVYNFWQDELNVRGLWRRTTLANYKSRNPSWETVLDFDQLSSKEDKNWVFKGADCLQRIGASTTRCMISLSDGGKDAVVIREFDVIAKEFVDDGFETFEAKQSTAWVDKDTILVATDWGHDGSTLTESGYPSSVRLWQRGQSLDAATTLYTGEKADVGVWPWVDELENGEIIFGAVQSDTFFTSRYWLLTEGDALQIPTPMKSNRAGIFDGYQFIVLQQDWDIEDPKQSYKSGDLVAFNLLKFLETRELPSVELVYRASDRQAVNNVSIAKGVALLSINDNVASSLLRLERGQSGWKTRPIDLPETGTASVYFANKYADTIFINFESFLTPDSLLEYDAATNVVSPLKSRPAKFNADGLVVHQQEATSSDGTQVPFFVIHHEGIQLDGSSPTLLYGYGGFEVSMNPGYLGAIGKLWLEKGGVYVLANIRGGGEFGPAWHQAGLKGNRQRVYDDFIAVGEKLLDMKITSPQHLGIMGGSNGGLLMGVMLNQRPDLWNAVVIQVPLLDMLRYHKLLAGASWVDEYGDPDVPAERAFLETISPYQNFDPSANYPTPFFVTSTKDDRVHPGHARKMAKLFEASGKPFFYYENIDGGHSAAANKKESAKRSALEFTYLTEKLFGSTPSPAHNSKSGPLSGST
ncbi:MAG: prolyl oligopeptidase [Candidatus Azotimanducaceae bacterium]|jgi:prolyl oligopeptidase